MGFFDTQNKDNILSYIVIIIIIAGLFILYKIFDKNDKNDKIDKIDKKNIDSSNNQITQNNISPSFTIDFSGNFGIQIKKDVDTININEYMNDTDELISVNKKYKVKFVNGMITLIHNISGKTLRTLDTNVTYQFYKKEKYTYTETDKNIINNGLIFITKTKLSDTIYNIKFTVLNKDGKILEISQAGIEKSNGYLKLDDCGNLIFYVDDKEKVDVFNLVEL
jgi:hypothetical protein